VVNNNKTGLPAQLCVGKMVLLQAVGNGQRGHASAKPGLTEQWVRMACTHSCATKLTQAKGDMGNFKVIGMSAKAATMVTRTTTVHLSGIRY
jgi:hypothetical protein